MCLLPPKKQGQSGFRPVKSGSAPALHGVGRRKFGLFHIFFHSCGKLRGETLRQTLWQSQGPDSNTRPPNVTNHPVFRGFSFDTRAGGSVPSRFLRSLIGLYRGPDDHERQAHVSTKPPATQSHPRVLGANGYQEWPARAQTPPGQGPQAVDGFLLVRLLRVVRWGHVLARSPRVVAAIWRTRIECSRTQACGLRPSVPKGSPCAASGGIPADLSTRLQGPRPILHGRREPERVARFPSRHRGVTKIRRCGRPEPS